MQVSSYEDLKPWVGPMLKYSYVRHTSIPSKFTKCSKGSDDICKKISKDSCCLNLEVIDNV